jgi:hypothetical protein
MLELAHYYAEQGWPIFPLVPGGKEPVISSREGGHGCHDATTDHPQIERWWQCHPDANIGVATGRRSGLLVVDVDMKDGRDGLTSINKLEPAPTFTVRTPSRGFHLYYLMPSGVRLTLGKDVLPGVDYRGEGGYVVAAGNRTAQGWYEIARNLPIAPLPARILEVLRPSGVKFLGPLPAASPARWARERARVADALAYLDPADYDTWIAVGLALHLASRGSQDAFDLWHAWSAGGLSGEPVANFAGEDGCRRKWASFFHGKDRDNTVGLGSVFYGARLGRETGRLARLRRRGAIDTSRGAA